MKGYLELHYISPHTGHKFDDKSDYLLVLTGLDLYRNQMNISKLKITNIDNINAEIRGFSLNHSVPITNVTFLNIMLFRLDPTNSQVYLLFTGMLDLNEREYYGIKYVALNQPPSANGFYRHAKYIDNKTFLQEQFYHYDVPASTESFCLLFFAKTHQTNFSLVPSTTLKFDENSMIAVYDRYKQVIVDELTPNISQTGHLFETHFRHLRQFIDKYCVPKAYDKYLNDYQIDPKLYQKAGENPFANKISLDLRPIYQEPYLNNILTSPTDGRIRGFKVNDTTKFILYNKTYFLKDFTIKPEQLIGGNGYLCRMNPQDYQRAFTPYGGYLTEISLYDTGVRTIVLKYESDYFIPPTVHERDYAAIIYGNFIHTGTGVGAGNRAYPELLKVQPDTYLIYYVVLMGSIELTNSKLNDLIKILPKNSVHRIKPVWVDQGEEIGYFGCSDGTVIMMTNRPIEFSADISYYSKMKLNSLKKPIDTYVKARDLVGLLF